MPGRKLAPRGAPARRAAVIDPEEQADEKNRLYAAAALVGLGPIRLRPGSWTRPA